MGIFGYGSGSSTGFGPSTTYLSLPYKSWKEVSAWLEETVDAIGNEIDVISQRFISSAARANLLNAASTSTDVPDNYRATATAAPLLATSQATMLDVLAYISLGIYPLDSNLTVAQKQALAQLGAAAIDRKGNRIYMLALAAAITDGVAFGWTVPPYNFPIVLPDGAPGPGYGNWVQATSALAETTRPWMLAAVRNTMATTTPSFISLGLGYSQFRAGYSAAGETVFPANARICILANEHFSSWSASVPVSWSKVGVGTLTQSTTASQINWEYTGNAAVFDFTAAHIGDDIGLNQTTSLINNQLTHRFQLDYAYTNAQNVGSLLVRIIDSNPDGSLYYWNATTGTWGTAIYNNVVPPSATRARYAIDIVPQAASATASTAGTSTITVKLAAVCDGTASTQILYTLYRAGLYEKFSLAAELAATGERSSWYPLVDAPDWTSAARSSSTAVLLEPANASRTAYKAVNSSTGVAFPYHPALTGRGYQSNSAWINIVKSSNLFSGASWTATNATVTANAVISPLVGETVASATQLTATSTAAQTTQQVGTAATNPASKSYVGGVWVKKLTSDASTVRVDLVTTTTQTATYTLTQAQGWQLLPITATFGVGDTANLNFRIRWANASATSAIACASAYLYDVTGKTGVLYPPIVQTPAGAVATLNATTCQATTQTTNTNVLNPLTQRALHSVVRGGLSLTVVPMFDAASQPSQVIFDLAQGAAQNRVVLRVNAGVLELRRWDNGGNQWVSNLTLSASSAPAIGSMTWRRDTSILIRAIWNENTTQISAGAQNAAPGTKPGTWAPSDTSVAKLYPAGSDFNGANQFDGIVTGVECIQLGAATV